MTSFDVLAALAVLSPLEREVLLDRVLLGRSCQALADQCGLSRQGVDVVERRAVRKMRRELARLVPEHGLAVAA